MRYGAMLMASALAAAVAACNAGAQEGERPTAQRDFRVGPFHSISLTGSPDVIVTVGGPYSVRAEGDARMVERLEIAAENGDLRIGYRESSSWGFPFGSRGGTTIHITVPALQGATITGSGDIRVNQVRGDRFAATVTGSGDLEIERLETGEAAFAVTGSGAIRAAAGSAQRANIQLQGSGDIELGTVTIREAVVAVMGSGDVSARATETARISLHGSGDVAITGPARCQVERRGSGEVHCETQG